ncbi:hypothetical protein [Flavobacterium flavigenum]|uniref:hypothetical protein n=1 Tax=Flavobacterium flavigenum TaxID=3003258 RepID=UPI0022AC3841|nr:hypothetical protein [Flavobacterium flavigenum]
MKTKLLFCYLFVQSICISQTKEIPSTLQNVIVTLKQISGNANPDRIVKIDVNNDKVVDYSIVVNYRGYFEQTLTTELKSGEIIKVWTVDELNKESTILEFTSATPEEILNKVKLNTISLPYQSINPELDGAQPASTNYKYNCRMLNTNFTIPIARFNLTKHDDTTSKQGDVILFNSIGAGVGMSWGQFEKTTDAKGEIINTEFTNSFGIHIGFLFSAGNDDTENKNVFAPSVSISVLDFQIGYGHELGTLAPSQKKGFLTLAYAIPISKLLKGKYYIFKSSKGYNSKNPLPTILIDEGSSNTTMPNKTDKPDETKKSNKANFSDWKRIRSFVG